METLWFCIVAFMLAAYVVLDGFDLGAGILHLFVARNENERRQIIRSIGPVWDGNEVWLLAAGGTLYFAFPGLYASSFSGFYLPLTIVLWLLILRGISLELRSHIQGDVWRPFWDAGFAGASAMLAIFFGAALGNVVRGVPLDRSGNFFLPLWTNFRVGQQLGILDWFTIATGLFAFCTLLMHGATWVALKTESTLQLRARRTALWAWWLVLAFTIAVTIGTFQLQPQVLRNFNLHPWGYVFPAIALGGLLGTLLFARAGDDRRAFLSSATYIVGMLTSAAFGIFPYVLPAHDSPDLGLTIYNTAAREYGLRIGLIWWVPGILLALLYTFFVYRHFAGKVSLEGEGY